MLLNLIKSGNSNYGIIKAPRCIYLRPQSFIFIETMTSITYLDGSSSEPEAVRFCRVKARDCLRTALVATQHDVRLRYLHLATLWREMGREAQRRSDLLLPSEGGGEVIFLQQFQKRSCASSKQTGDT
jgi:hypothetical protein